MKAAVFLDRDGTLIHDPGFLSEPAEVDLLPGVGAALARLQAAEFSLVVISNQSGIGRGLITPADVEAIQLELSRQLVSCGVVISAWGHCPHLPDAGCKCRKPGTVLHREAARAQDIDLTRSWCVGDRISDVSAAASLGARAVLVKTGEGSRHAAAARAVGIAVAEDLTAATELILAAAW